MRILKHPILAGLLLLPILSACITGTTGANAPGVSEVVISVTVPDPTWDVEIVAAHRIAQEVWVLSVLNQNKDATGAQVITTVEDRARIETGAAEVRHFVVGRTFAWESQEPYTFLESTDEYYRMLPPSAIKIFDRWG